MRKTDVPLLLILVGATLAGVPAFRDRILSGFQARASEERPRHQLDGDQGYDGTVGEAQAQIDAMRAPCLATYDRFKKIRQGSPRYFVKNVMRCEGELVASERVGYGNYETYRFMGREAGSFMLVQIRDQTVSSTFQLGLRP